MSNREKPGLGTGCRVNMDCPPIGDDKTLSAEGFQSDVIGARRDRAFDTGGQ